MLAPFIQAYIHTCTHIYKHAYTLAAIIKSSANKKKLSNNNAEHNVIASSVAATAITVDVVARSLQQ